MGAHKNFIDSVDNIIDILSTQTKAAHLTVDYLSPLENTITIEGKALINFGSCSYMGMEFDERLIEGSIKTLRRFGSQFSSSRAYLSISEYDELEGLLSQIFEAHCIVTPTTTLGHISTLPIIVEEDDAVIADQLVHNSVFTAIELLKSKRVHVERVRHNNMEALEKRIMELKNRHSKIWYMADGIYSMYGDTCPIHEIERLLNKHKEFHVYLDEAHSMSCYGKHGRGFVLSKIKMHERMVIASSLNKAFAAGGGVIVFPNKEWKRKVRNCGGPLMFSGPVQPAVLGAGIASAKILLSDEIVSLQDQLHSNIEHTQKTIERLGLPCISNNKSTIFFIGVSLPKIAKEIIPLLKEAGYFLNIGIFPSVPMRNTGIRFTITRLHNKEEITKMLVTFERILGEVLKRNNFSYNDIYQAFRMKPPQATKISEKATIAGLKIERYSTIKEVNKEEWDSMFSNCGIINYGAMELLESSFSGNFRKEHNWDVEYLIIKDKNNKPILATYLTISLNKDDSMSDQETSEDLEKIRKHNPYFLSSEILSVGSAITDGEQMYLDKNNPNWKDALHVLLDLVNKIQLKKGINQIMVREFVDPSPELEKVFMDNGFFKLKFPNNNYFDNWDWDDMTSYRATLANKRYRKRFSSHIKRFIPNFDFCEATNPTPAQIDYWYELYMNVKNNSLDFNTFSLPKKLFENIVNNKDWKVFELYPTEKSNNGEEVKPAAVIFIHFNGVMSNPAIIGIDYKYQEEGRVYNQMLYRVVLWCKEHGGIQRINLGYTADREKKRIGAKQQEVFAFMQIEDDYNMKLIAEKDGGVVKVKAKI